MRSWREDVQTESRGVMAGGRTDRVMWGHGGRIAAYLYMVEVGSGLEKAEEWLRLVSPLRRGAVRAVSTATCFSSCATWKTPEPRVQSLAPPPASPAAPTGKTQSHVSQSTHYKHAVQYNPPTRTPTALSHSHTHPKLTTDMHRPYSTRTHARTHR